MRLLAPMRRGRTKCARQGREFVPVEWIDSIPDACCQKATLFCAAVFEKWMGFGRAVLDAW
jgi:hypothetical protein